MFSCRVQLVHSVHCVCVFIPSNINELCDECSVMCILMVPLLGFNKSFANIEMALPALSVGCGDEICAAF